MSTSRSASVPQCRGHYPDGSGIESFREILFASQVGYLSMARNGFRVARLRVLPKGVFLALSSQHAAMPAKMSQEPFTFHPITTRSCLASGGRERKDSSRLCS